MSNTYYLKVRAMQFDGSNQEEILDDQSFVFDDDFFKERFIKQ